MARELNCVCGRRFHIGQHSSRVQCRKCGRWWSCEPMTTLDVVATVFSGGELARTRKKPGKRKRSSTKSCMSQQTSRRRPPNNPIGALVRLFLG
jgi:hypothetical protein